MAKRKRRTWLRAEIETLALRYPTYGYRRITQLLVNQGYPVGYRRVARLMKAAHLSVSVKRICQTTRSLEGETPWVNRVQLNGTSFLHLHTFHTQMTLPFHWTKTRKLTVYATRM